MSTKHSSCALSLTKCMKSFSIFCCIPVARLFLGFHLCFVPLATTVVVVGWMILKSLKKGGKAKQMDSHSKKIYYAHMTHGM